MKTITFKRLSTVLLATGMLSLSGCVKDLYVPPTDPDPLPEPSTEGSFFYFKTEKSYTLNVRYDVPKGYKVDFAVYNEIPVTIDENGQAVMKDIAVLDRGTTDELGVYSHSIKIPAITKKLYIYTTDPGVPQLLTAEVTGDALSPATELITTDVISRANAQRSGYQDAMYNQIVMPYTTYRLGYWHNSEKLEYKGTMYTTMGRPDYLLPDPIVVTSDIYDIIKQELPEGGRINEANLGCGDINVVKEASYVDLYLLSEGTGASCTLAYYCYDTNNPPKNKSDIKEQIVALPNAKELQNHTLGNPRGFNGALKAGEGIRLHYFKDGIDKGTTFPPNTSIGWVLYNNSYLKASTNDNEKLIGTLPNAVFSNPTLMNGNKFVALFRKDNFIIYGFEDWQPNSDCNDVVLNIKSDPIEAITPDIPVVKPEEPGDDVVKYEVPYAGMLMYEDLWPMQGDFDMNDVVVKYNSIVSYNKSNEVLKTTDTFTLIHSGATFHDSFAYQIMADRGEADVEITSSTGDAAQAYVDPTQPKTTIRLFNDALALTNDNKKISTITVTTKYKRRYDKDVFLLPPYNPFITTTNKNKEVHLTGYKPTDAANKSDFGTGDDRSDLIKGYYYVTFLKGQKEQQMPFAIHIPMDIDFIISSENESKRIDTLYPKFINWIATKGSEDADWYLHPKK